jgi:hypothetical protein
MMSLPVETVHIINQASLHHLQNHAENVEDITEKGHQTPQAPDPDLRR